MARKKSKNTLTYPSLPALFSGICDAIRFKTGSSGLINHQEIPSIIRSIVTSEELSPVLYQCKISNNTPTSYEYTATKDGYIYITITGTYVGSDQTGVTINGTTVNPDHSSTASGSRNAIIKTYVKSVSEGDTIVITLISTSAAYFEGGVSIFE